MLLCTANQRLLLRTDTGTQCSTGLGQGVEGRCTYRMYVIMFKVILQLFGITPLYTVDSDKTLV